MVPFYYSYICFFTNKFSLFLIFISFGNSITFLDKSHGVIEYYENGNIKYEGFYKDGEMDGKLIKYSKNLIGEIETIQNYKNGELDDRG